jgi:hypothetical protein
MAETAALDNVLGVRTNIGPPSPIPSAFNFTDGLSNPNTLPGTLSNPNTLPDPLANHNVGFALTPSRLATTASEPLPNLASESMAQFLNDIAATLGDVE